MEGTLPLPPPGLNYIVAIRPPLIFILILTPLGAILVPLTITLFFFSTPQSRRHPVFILNILACCSGIIEAALYNAVQIKLILFPVQPISKTLLTSAVACSILGTLFTESILLFRILAFYPISLTSRRRLLAIFAVPIVVKLGRFIAIGMYLYEFTHNGNNFSILIMSVAQSAWPKSGPIIVAWSLQIIDNTYASVFLLSNIYQLRQKRKYEGIIIIRSKTLLARLRSCFIIALGNFIFPIIMDIAALIMVYAEPSFLIGSYVVIANNYLTIMGIVFATIWNRRQIWSERYDRASVSASITLTEKKQANSLTFDRGVIVRREEHFGREEDGDLSSRELIVEKPWETMMDSEDIVMVDVEESDSTTSPIKSNWVKPPTLPEDLCTTWTAETSTSQNLVEFLSRWPPSHTPAIYGPWITVERCGHQPTSTLTPPTPDIKGLSASFQALALSGTVTTETLDEISKAHNVISGKWMIFEEPDKIDMLWGKLIYHLCVERQKGFAKVSTWKKGERHVICVYVDDYTDLEEVNGLRKALEDIGVYRRIGFKPDAYTHLGIYKENAWNIRPSRYLE